MMRMRVRLTRELVTRIIEVHASARMDGALGEDAIGAVVDALWAEVVDPGRSDVWPVLRLTTAPDPADDGPYDCASCGATISVAGHDYRPICLKCVCERRRADGVTMEEAHRRLLAEVTAKRGEVFLDPAVRDEEAWRVIFDGVVQSPSFRARGPAEVFLAMLASGKRRPETG